MSQRKGPKRKWVTAIEMAECGQIIKPGELVFCIENRELREEFMEWRKSWKVGQRYLLTPLRPRARKGGR